MEQTYKGILDKDIITDLSKINPEKLSGYIMANAGKEFSSKNIENYLLGDKIFCWLSATILEKILNCGT